MLKVFAAVLAVLSAVISITIYTATLPAIQKQAEDNAAAIETLGGSVSDNAEAIQTLEGKHLYQHNLTIADNTENSYKYIYICIIDNDSESYTFTKLFDFLKNQGINKKYPCSGMALFTSNVWHNILAVTYGLQSPPDTYTIYFVRASGGSLGETSTRILDTYSFNDKVTQIL